MGQGELLEAKQILRETLRSLRRVLGPNDKQTLLATENVALVLRQERAQILESDSEQLPQEKSSNSSGARSSKEENEEEKEKEKEKEKEEDTDTELQFCKKGAAGDLGEQAVGVLQKKRKLEFLNLSLGQR